MGVSNPEADYAGNSQGLLPSPSPASPDFLDETVEPRTVSGGKSLVQDVLISTFWLLFALLQIAFAVYVARKDHQVVQQSTWNIIHEICLKLGTVFPIVFAATIALSIKRYASWRLERGTVLGAVEQLMGSLTVGSVVSTTYSLRAINLTAVILTVIWSLSPLGSQSALLMARTEDVAAQHETTVAYLDTVVNPAIATGGGTMFSDGDLFIYPALNGLYNACLLESNSTRAAGQDLWGNVRLPDLSRSKTTSEDDGWEKLGDQHDIVYSSLVGVPVHGLSLDSNSTFSMESSYLSTVCTGAGMPVAGKLPQSVAVKELPNYTQGVLCENSTGTWTLCLDGFYNSTKWGTYGTVALFGNGTAFEFPARSLSFQSTVHNFVAQCLVSTSYVESSVSCAGTNCSVVAMRESTLPHPHANYTGLSFSQSFQEFATGITQSAGSGLHDGTSSATEFFLANPASAGLVGTILTDFTGTTADEVGIRLQQLVNTYWYGSFAPTAFMAGLTPGTSSPIRNRTASGVASELQVRYVVKWRWLAIFVIAAAVMALGAMAGLLLALKIRGPDILGYFSTTVANSQFVSQGRGVGSTMGGAERGRKYKNLRLKLVDVYPDNDVGYIALTGDSGVAKGRPLERGRLYR